MKRMEHIHGNESKKKLSHSSNRHRISEKCGYSVIGWRKKKKENNENNSTMINTQAIRICGQWNRDRKCRH